MKPIVKPSNGQCLDDLGQALAPSWEGYDVNLTAPWEESNESNQDRTLAGLDMGKSSPNGRTIQVSDLL
jgi:hypothetical protein